MKLNDKTCLIVDSGICCEIAARLSLDFKKTYYCTPSFSGFPEHKTFAPGLGMGNIIKMDADNNPIKFWDVVDEADIVVVPDVGMGDISSFIRRHFPDKRVFGAGGADRLEENRKLLKDIQKSIGLPVQEYEYVVGMEQLRERLKTLKDVVIKPSGFRGDRETFKMHDYEDIEMILTDMDSAYGVGKFYQPFVIEHMLEFIAEAGCDLFYNGREFIAPYLWGIEYGAPYIGKYDKELPETLKKTVDALKPILDSYGYRGALSTEELIVTKELSYLLDLTPRFPQPLASIFTESISNFSEVMWKVSGGENVEIKNNGKYIGCLPIQSDTALSKWVRVIYSDEFKDNVKMVFGCKWNDRIYAIKGFATVANIVAYGNTAKDVVFKLEEILKEVDADDVEKETSSLHKILSDFDELREVGIKF